MDLIISGKNFKLTPDVKQYTQTKMGRLKRYWSRIVRVRVELKLNKKGKNTHEADVLVEVPGKDIRLEQPASSPRQAIDLLMPKLERLLNKAKAKLSQPKRRRLNQEQI